MSECPFQVGDIVRHNASGECIVLSPQEAFEERKKYLKGLIHGNPKNTFQATWVRIIKDPDYPRYYTTSNLTLVRKAGNLNFSKLTASTSSVQECPECKVNGEYVNGAFKCPECWKTWW